MTAMKSSLAFCVIIILSACQQEESAQVEIASSTDIVIGQIEILHSNILNEDRALWLYLPQSMQSGALNAAKYPVLYLLDGSSNFHSMSGIIQHLDSVIGNSVLPEMIVVGIPNTDRMRDLTPTHVEGTSGGGDSFLDFIELELIPHIENSYPASNYRTLVGHSLGGLMVIDSLTSRPHVFNNYVAIDPSLWWDEQTIMHKAENALKERSFQGESLYVAVANTISEKIDIDEVMNNTDEATLHIRSILHFANAVNETKDNGLEFAWKYYGEESHGSIPLIAEYDALRFLFSWYQLQGMDEYLTTDSSETSEELITHFNSHYAGVSSRFGYEVIAPEQFTNNMGQALLTSGKPAHSLEFFNLNLQNYPDSAIANAALGDYYAAQSDIPNAKIYFTRAIELGSGSATQDKLAKLENGQP